MGISVIGGSGGGTVGSSGFSLIVGTSGNTTYTFDSFQPAGAYSITSQLGDATFDVYLVNAADENVGYTNTRALEATSEFNRVVLYGATANDILNFEYKPGNSAETSGDVADGAAPFLTSATPTVLKNVDDSTTVTGGNFATDVQITFTGTDDVVRNAKSVVRSSSTTLIVTRPDDMPAIYGPYTMTATNVGIQNPSTGANILVDYFGAGIAASGGVITEDANYIYHTFSSSGTFNLVVPVDGDNLEYLIVAGGGGSANMTAYSCCRSSGGGGAGGLLQGTISASTAFSAPVLVGAGGSASGKGSNSAITGYATALGGGIGSIGNISQDDSNGGSGGGQGADSGPVGLGTAGQGFNGAARPTGNDAGGGGGAGLAGSGGTGGNGVLLSAWAAASGVSHDGGYFAGGGAGAGYTNSGVAGLGGGGGTNSSGIGSAGDANSGGGGGSSRNNQVGAPGGSGIVIVRYAK